MTNRNYDHPTVSREWAESRETHIAVATAIHAIARTRTPDAIWEAPSSTEWDNVAMALEEYIRCGDFPAEPDGRYQWGLETIALGAPIPERQRNL